MVNLTDLILVVDNVLSDSECDFLISVFEERESNPNVPYQLKSYREQCFESNSNEIRESTVDIQTLLPKTDPFILANRGTDTMVKHYKEYIDNLSYFWTHALIGDLSYSHKYRLMKYGVGQSIHDHVDKNPTTYGSCTLALNDGYQGGKFRFFKGNHLVDLKKGQGMIFPADYFFVHGVEPITEGHRYSVNSFLGSADCVLDASQEPTSLREPGSDISDYCHTSAIESVELMKKAVDDFPWDMEGEA
jgi:hypothetical protein